MLADRYQADGKATLKLNSLQEETRDIIEDKITKGQYTFESISCPICQKDAFKQLTEKDRYGLFCPNVACLNCGLVMINPRMTTQSYNEFYDLEYRNLYTGKRANAANFFNRQLIRGEGLYQFLNSRGLLPTDKKTPFALEIGCGAGGILKYFASKGFQTKGIDLGSEYLHYGAKHHGLDLTVGTIADLKLSRVPDIIIYSHVLEHIPDPNSEMEHLRTIAGDHTLIYVEVPGIKNLSSGYRSDPLRYFQNAHPYSFSLRSLQNLFQKNGFEMAYGNEFVKSIFKLAAEPVREFENDYDDVLNYLKAAERDRKYYSFSMARFKILGGAVFNYVSNIVKK